MRSLYYHCISRGWYIKTDPNTLKFDADTIVWVPQPYNKLKGDAKNEVIGIRGIKKPNSAVPLITWELF
jgi:hypothetical protein